MTLTAYQNPTQAVAALTKLYQGLPASGRFANMVLKEKPKVTESAQTYRGFTFTEVRLTLDFAATVESLPENVREMTLSSLKRVLKEKTVFWIGTDGKVVTQLTAKDWDAAKKLLDEYLDGKTVIGGVPGFQVTRKNLPDDATAVSLFETGQLLIMLIEQVKTAGAAFPGGLPAIGTPKAVKGDPTYVGMAITLKPRVATVDGFLPGSAMNVATKMLLPLFQNIE